MGKGIKMVLTLLAMAGIISAWLIGSWRYDNETIEQVKRNLPDQFPIEQLSENIYKITTDDHKSLFVSVG